MDSSGVRLRHQGVVVRRGQWTTGIPGVHHAGWLDEDRMNFAVRDRAVLDTAGDDKQLAGAQGDGAITHLNIELALDNQEEFVGVGVRVPDKLAGEFDHLDLVVIQSSDDLRRPVFGELSELVAEINGFAATHGFIIATRWVSASAEEIASCKMPETPGRHDLFRTAPPAGIEPAT